MLIRQLNLPRNTKCMSLIQAEILGVVTTCISQLPNSPAYGSFRFVKDWIPEWQYRQISNFPAWFFSTLNQCEQLHCFMHIGRQNNPTAAMPEISRAIKTISRIQSKPFPQCIYQPSKLYSLSLRSHIKLTQGHLFNPNVIIPVNKLQRCCTTLPDQSNMHYNCDGQPGDPIMLKNITTIQNTTSESKQELRNPQNITVEMPAGGSSKNTNPPLSVATFISLT